jgi:hypothetical protein
MLKINDIRKMYLSFRYLSVNFSDKKKPQPLAGCRGSEEAPGPYFTSSSVTSKIRLAFGGIGPAPLLP